MNVKRLIPIVAVIIVLGGAWAFLAMRGNNAAVITTFEQCAAKYPVLESYPEQCNTPDGKHFVHDVSNVIVTAPQPNAVVTSPLTVTGQAPGTWYFEASFPVRVEDANGNVLAQAPAQAQSDWTTTSSVPFAATLKFTTPATQTGTLVLKNDNPSGNPTKDKQISIPVQFANVVSSGSGITGYVHVGPTCPVERMPPDPNCADRPFVGATIDAVNQTTKKSYYAEIDATGKFMVTAPIGMYSVTAYPSGDYNIFPRCEEKQVTLKANQFVSVDISCDSGIR